MGFYFRRSRKILPGVRMNLSKNGVGFSFGTRGARYSISPTGRRTASIGIPGTGLSYRSYSGATKQVPRASTNASSTYRVGSTSPTHHGSPSSALRAIAWCVLLALATWVVADFFAPISKLGKNLKIIGTGDQEAELRKLAAAEWGTEIIPCTLVIASAFIDR